MLPTKFNEWNNKNTGNEITMNDLKEAGFSSVRSIKVTLPIQTGLIVAEA